MSCCGKARKANTEMVAYEDGVKLIYSGSKEITFITPSRRTYRFDSRSRKIQEVHPDDVQFLLTRYNKIYSMFKLYNEAPIVQNMLPSVTVEEIVEALSEITDSEEALDELVATAQAEGEYDEEVVEEDAEEPVKKSRRKKKEE